MGERGLPRERAGCWGGGVQIRVKAVPNAKRSEVVGWEEDPRVGRVLKVRIAAPPVEGKANKALCVLLAGWLRTSKSKVRLMKGEGARIKTFEVAGGDLPDVDAPT